MTTTAEAAAAAQAASNAGHPGNAGWTPVPDPTQLTTNAVEKLRLEVILMMVAGERLTDEKFAGVTERFHGLEARTAEQKSDTTKALTDALAAQKEQAQSQTLSSEKSITKSETATTERIKGVEAQLATTIKAQDDKYADLKDRVVAIETARLSQHESTTEHRAGSTLSLQALVALLAFATLALGIALAVKK